MHGRHLGLLLFKLHVGVYHVGLGISRVVGYFFIISCKLNYLARPTEWTIGCTYTRRLTSFKNNWCRCETLIGHAEGETHGSICGLRHAMALVMVAWSHEEGRIHSLFAAVILWASYWQADSIAVQWKLLLAAWTQAWETPCGMCGGSEYRMVRAWYRPAFVQDLQLPTCVVSGKTALQSARKTPANKYPLDYRIEIG